MDIKNAINNYLQKQDQTKISLKAVLFDMDGVLFDSMPAHAQSWLETAHKHQLEAKLEDFYFFEGCVGFHTIDQLFQKTFDRHATKEEIDTIYEEKSNRFAQLNDGEPMKGATAVLEQTSKSGLKQILVTGSGQHSLFDKLDKVFPSHFSHDKMVTAYDVKHGKPNPEPYLRGLQKAHVKANEAVVIENAPMGIRSAVAAGIFTIAVNTGPLTDEILLKEGADLLYPDMNSLAADWTNLMNLLK